MRKNWLLAIVLSLILSSCAIPFLQPTAAPAPPVDLDATAGVFVQQTLLAQPSSTLLPSNTSVVTTPTLTAIPATATATQDPSLLTLTATLGTGSVTATSTLTTSTPTATPVPPIGATATVTLHPRFFGTVPPDPPFGFVKLINRSRAETYISLQCTASDGTVTIIEYPVRRTRDVKAPAGSYIVVAWVGGRQMTGSFRLGKDETITLTMLKDKLVIVNK